MRAVGLLLISAWPIMAAVGRAETKFPYQVTIPAGNVELRSGPGLGFYATDRLSAGDRVEVFREEKDGWLAVRPPKGCFSLVERSQLKPAAEPGVATATEDDVLCCVGSRIESVQTYVSQVRLRKGERVELLEKWDVDQKSATDSDRAAWCRIWPPAGEFRWLHADDLKPAASARANAASPTDGAATDQKPTIAPKTSFEADGWQARPAATVTARPASEPAPAGGGAAVGGALTDPSSTSSSPPPKANSGSRSQDASTGWKATPQPAAREDGAGTMTGQNTAAAKPKSPAASQVRVPVDGERVLVEATAKPTDRTDPSGPSNPTEQWTSRTPPPLQPIAELELELSMMVAGDMRTWRLAGLRQRVDANLVRYESTAERVEARQLLDRIAEFEQLQGRMAQPASGSSPVDSAVSAASPVPVPVPAETAAKTANDVQYDGSGWLVPVHSATGTAPPFALLDAQGEVMGYVSPTPGLNLQRYVRKQVGIFGQRGYVPSLNKPHVTAERIVDLDRHLR